MKKNLSLRFKSLVGWLLAVGFLSSGVVSTTHANLLRNASFETVPIGSFHGQGFLPDDWIQGLPTGINADTYSNDGSYGLASGNANFGSITAQNGIRWVAGWSIVPESFSQQLSATLSVGQSYTLSGYLIQATRTDLDHVGGYDVYLTANSTLGSIGTGAFLGRLGPTTDSDSWEANSFNFTAPLNAGALPFFTFKPVATSGAGEAYPGLDNLSLDVTVVPEPTTIIAGALLLLPFAANALRRLRKSRAA